MPTPINELVAEMVSELDEDLRYEFEERAGVMEFDAKLERAHAECLALLNVLRNHPTELVGVKGIWVKFKGEVCWMLTTHLHYAREKLVGMGGEELVVMDIREHIEEIEGGLVLLAKVK